ncbi:MAG: carboxymuconolactone decarboxylase family protein [Acidibacillus sp.]|uniref:Carboxymuconolactone decarboxylase-like domain-containing protein n=1 Tax=Sulfoacidibacillus ferrooxidans TaxID=2005001 RepID=A0A9X1V741_9BACL|nr:carboxymuconolactone decarboxylase family protein [Sulfoacidibacillus ferrooxidans]MCI0182478.1 hypothetical protein [Sulfoacidibacillus ferrooxidans]MCY0894247.1 carboxymuconolactone decarboxylase family protein [Acidibacillus sp.]
MNEHTKVLLQVAAAFALGCESCLEKQIAAAKQVGISEHELQEVLTTVRGVKLTATLTFDELATKMVRQQVEELEVIEVQGSSCGCGSGNC